MVLLVHLTLRWDWVIRTTRKLVRRGGRERFVWLVNLLLLLSMTLCIASGILISQVALPGLGITLPASSFWRQMHGDADAVLVGYSLERHGCRRRTERSFCAAGWRVRVPP